MLNGMRNKLIGDNRGSIALEYVIWFPIFSIFLLAVVEVSLVLFSHARMWDVARDFGRRVAVGELSASQAESGARSSLPGLLVFNVSVDDTSQPGQVVVNVVATDPDLFVGVYSLFSPTDELRTTFTIRDER